MKFKRTLTRRHENKTITKQDRRSKRWGWQGGGQPSAFLKFFLTPSAVQLTSSTHPLYEMIEFQITLSHCVCRQCQDRLAQLQRSHTPSNLPSSHILCNPTGVDPLTYTLPSNAPPCSPPKNVFEMQENINHNARTRHDSPIPISPTNTYSLTLRYPTGVDLPTYPPTPTHNTYSLFLVSLPASIFPYTHPTHNTCPLILRDLTSISPHTPHTYSLILVFQAHRSPHIRPFPTHNTYNLFLVSQAHRSPHIHPLPTHNT